MRWVISISSTHSASASFLALLSAFRFLPLIFSIKVHEVASIQMKTAPCATFWTRVVYRSLYDTSWALSPYSLASTSFSVFLAPLSNNHRFLQPSKNICCWSSRFPFTKSPKAQCLQLKFDNGILASLYGHSISDTFELAAKSHCLALQILSPFCLFSSTEFVNKSTTRHTCWRILLMETRAKCRQQTYY